MDERVRTLKAHSQNREEDGDSRRPRWRSWSVTTKLIYIIGPTLKRSPKLKPYYDDPRNPTTAVLVTTRQVVLLDLSLISGSMKHKFTMLVRSDLHNKMLILMYMSQ